MIASFQVADVGFGTALCLLYERFDPQHIPGLRFGAITSATPLGGSALATPFSGRVGVLGFWVDDDSFELFLRHHPLVHHLRPGFHTRLQPARGAGRWSDLPGLEQFEEPLEDDEPVAVLTLNRLRLRETLRFRKANARAARAAKQAPGLTAALELTRSTRFHSTFSTWSSVSAMRSYAYGERDFAHSSAIGEDANNPFHDEGAYIRFRPYSWSGDIDGRQPFPGVAHRPPPLREPAGWTKYGPADE